MCLLQCCQKNTAEAKTIFFKNVILPFFLFFRQKMSSPNSTSLTMSIFLNKKDRVDYFMFIQL